jgi:RNA polymerase sigma-70 factor (ECF subfamily)
MIQLCNEDDLTPVHALPRRGYTDVEIVIGLAAGTPTAADALVDRYGASISRRVWRLLGADPEHDDVVQTVFVHVLQSINSLADPKALPDWIAKTTVNVVRNELRRRKTRRMVSFAPEPGPDLPSHADPEEEFRLRRALAILNTMKIEDRICFIMRYIEGAEFKEIAAATGQSLPTVKRRVPRAREVFLKKAMRDRFLAELPQQESEDER